MRLSQPMRAVQPRIQASSAWAGTALWAKTIDFAGSIPLAISAAAISRTFARSCAGSTSTVSAWRSARKNRHSASSCIRTQRRIAPSRLPRCRPPVGWMPETTRIGAVISRHRCRASCGCSSELELVLVGAAQDPDQREIDQPSRRRRWPMTPARRCPTDPANQLGQDHADGDQRRDHRGAGDQLPDDARGEPGFDPEMAAAVEDHVEDRRN